MNLLFLQVVEAASAPPTEDRVKQKLEPYPEGVKVNTSNHRLMNGVSTYMSVLFLQDMEAATTPPTEDRVKQKLQEGIKVNTGASNHRLMINTSTCMSVLLLQEVEAATAPSTEDRVEQKLEPYPERVKVNTSNHNYSLMNSVSQPTCLYCFCRRLLLHP